MSVTTTDPVTIDRIARALEDMGVFPFISSKDQVAALLPNRTIRFIVPPTSPAQGVVDYPRFFHPSHQQALLETMRTLNASTYVPKATTYISEQGMIGIRLFHCFNWVAGATDEQLAEEVQQFVLASIAVQNRLDQMYVDPWTKETSNA